MPEFLPEESDDAVLQELGEDLHSLDPFAIKVPMSRQRKEFAPSKIQELADSIHEVGQIQPIVIDTNQILIAGERRLKAVKHILHSKDTYENWDNFKYIKVSVISPQDDWHRHTIELQENIKREPLTPAEESRAVDEYERLMEQRKGKQKRGRGAVEGGHSQKDTAKDLNISEASVSDHRKVARVLDIAQHIPELKNLEDESSKSGILGKFKAYKIKELRGEIARRAMESHRQDLEGIVVLSDALDWLGTLKEESVDLVLTDLPFGIDVFESHTLAKSSHGTQWQDDEETVRDFVHELIPRLYLALKPNAHMWIFSSWIQTFWIERACTLIPDLEFEYPPWIWNKIKSTPAINGAATGDQTYEYLCHLRKGTVNMPERLGPNIVSFQRPMSTKYPTERPLDLLKHFIEMCTLEGELVIDPCCGSGGHLVAAIQSGRRALGCDKNPEAIKVAKSRLVLETPHEAT